VSYYNSQFLHKQGMTPQAQLHGTLKSSYSRSVLLWTFHT